MVATFLMVALILTMAQDGARPTPMPLWPQGAPLAKGSQPEDIPTISLYLPPPEKASGAAIVICPGGGYQHLADHERT